MRHLFVKCLLATLVAVLSSICALPSLPAPLPSMAGSLTLEGGMPILRLQGSPYEMGAQHGILLRQPLRQIVQDYLYDGFFRGSPTAHADLLAWGRNLDRRLPQGIRRELAGIADGAGLAYFDVLLLNALPDYVCLTDRLPGSSTAASMAAVPDGCGFVSAAFAAWGSSTYGGELIVGYCANQERDVSSGRPWVLALRKPTHGNASVSLSAIGSVGVWLGVTENALIAALLRSPSVDVAADGPPLTVVLRQALEGSDNLEALVGEVIGSARSSGGNLVMGDATAPEALSIEMSAHRHALFRYLETEQFVTCADYFVDSELAVTRQDGGGTLGRAGNETRQWGLRMALQLNHGWIGKAKALQFVGEYGAGSRAMALGLNGREESTCLLQGILLSRDQITLMWAAGCTAANPDGCTSLELGTLFAGTR